MVQAFFEKSAELSEADIVISNKNHTIIYEKVLEFINAGQPIRFFDEHKSGENYITPPLTDFSERTRAFMKIEDGCDRFCSYCIIPYSRGRVRSRKLSDIKKEAEILSQKGFKEIVLVGINLSAYGKGSELSLADAVKTVCGIEGIERVRLGSLEPDHITDRMLESLKNEKKFCPQFHLSLQSGCDATLKRMNRHYTADFYLELISKIRSIFDNPSITTDIMVGFAGETEEEFQESLEFVKKAEFSQAHIFAYSKRSGTKAAEMANQVTNSEKERRSHLMIEATLKSKHDFLKRQIGLTCPVLFEEDNYGYTPNYSRVYVKCESALCSHIADVKIVGLENDILIGEII
jgi:threonylcarbamoyladenosine tRNA methylthiotransferase MtaB